jgi:serine/threonine-protein kinase RsbW
MALWHVRCISLKREAFAMSGMPSLNTPSDSQSLFSGKHHRSSVMEVQAWMPSKIQAISPLVDRLMRLIEGSQCVPGEEFDVELALREALANAAIHGNQEDPEKKVRICCRCKPGNEVSIEVTDQGEGFDFEQTAANSLISDPAAEHGRGIALMKAFMDEVHFAQGGSQVHMRKRARKSSH